MTCDICLRDPFILLYNGLYYMYGSCGTGAQNILEVFKSNDLNEWSSAKTIVRAEGVFDDVIEFWAPEVYSYNGKFYMFVTVKKKDKRRGIYILVSDAPDGEFLIHSNGAITPEEWECLDGTLYIEDEKLYMVFCHEWTQITNGEVCAIELTNDLRSSNDKPAVLFKAADCGWAKPFGNEAYVTDGPFLFCEDGELYMLWSSFIEDCKYAVGLAHSKNGSLFGGWKHNTELLYKEDGGHAMLFDDLDKVKRIVFHISNSSSHSKPKIMRFVKKNKHLFSCEE